MEWATLPLKKYADFSGRSRRKEYWSFFLLALVAGLMLTVVERTLDLSRVVGPYGPLTSLFLLALLVPALAVGVRRLHDTERSGWWLLIGYGPFLLTLVLTFAQFVRFAMILSILALVGFVVLLAFMVMEGTRGPNQYGPDPKDAEPAPAKAA